MSLADRINARKRRYIKNVHNASLFVAFKGSENAPKGWSLQLSRSGINALPPVVNGTKIIGIITASAISAARPSWLSRVSWMM